MPRPKGSRKYDYDYPTFAGVLREALAVLKISPWELARLTAIDKRTLRGVLAGARGLSVPDRSKVIRALVQVSKAKGVSLDVPTLRQAGSITPAGEAPSDPQRHPTPFPAAVGAATASTPDPVPRSEHWLRLAQQLSAVRQRARASDAYDLAARVAGDDPKVLALVTAHHAHLRSEMDDLGAARDMLAQVLDLLDAGDLRPESGVSMDAIEGRFAGGDHTALRAYAVGAKTSAYLFYTRERFALAAASSRTFAAAADLLADPGAQAEAQHILGKTLVAMGADIGDSHEGERAWRCARDRGKIELGLAHLRHAQTIRPVADHVGLLRDLHQEGKASLVLGDVAGATRAGEQARELFGASWTPIEVPMDWARREIAAGSLRRAHESLCQVLDLAWATGAIELHARALIGLGEVELVAATNRQRVLDYSVAAMLAWPFGFDQRDFRRAVRLFRRLHATPREFERSVASERPPLEAVVALPHVNAGRMMAILNHLEKIATKR
jgi:hypothetical protein